MDTQGIFDTKNTVKECAAIFALSLLTSSIQIYNLMYNLQENDLEYLEYFADYGRLALKDKHSDESGSRPFQSLILLVRDWPYSYEYEYGFDSIRLDGEETLLQKRLQDRGDREKSDSLKSYFEMSCFLMPHPGLQVNHPQFAGSLNGMVFS